MEDKIKRPKHLWKPGESGNPGGRPKHPDIQAFRDAVKKIETEEGKRLFEYAVQRAFKNDKVLVELLHKILPSKIEMDAGENVLELEERKQRMREFLLEWMGVKVLEKRGQPSMEMGDKNPREVEVVEVEQTEAKPAEVKKGVEG